MVSPGFDGCPRVHVELPELGHAVRRPATLRAWLRAYAAATSTTAAYNAILDAATPGETDKPAKTTTIGYRDVLTQLWLLDPQPGWLPIRSVFARLAQAPEHHLADPALAARLLGTNAAALLTGRDPAPPTYRSPGGRASTRTSMMWFGPVKVRLAVRSVARRQRVLMASAPRGRRR